jgi:hypothetical protein
MFLDSRREDKWFCTEWFKMAKVILIMAMKHDIFNVISFGAMNL